MDQVVTNKKPLVSIVCLTVLALCNFVAYSHFLTSSPATKQELPTKSSFFSTYIFYLFCQGFLAPVIVISSIEPMKLYARHRMRECNEKLCSVILDRICPKRKKNTVNPINTHV